MISNRKIKFIIPSVFILAVLFSNTIVNAQVVINEIIAKNISVNVDPDYQNYCDWIELYSKGGNIVDISGYYLTDDPGQINKWSIPNGTILSPGEFLIIWADRNNNGYHTSYQLDSNGETIALYNNIGIFLDSISYPVQKSNYSYGRYPDGSNNYYYFSTPTPNQPNSSNYILGLLDPPVFSMDAGFYSGNLSISLSSAGNIRYTTDGSVPDQNSTLYTSPININKTTVIRAFASLSNYLPSDVTANTYIINGTTDLPVISLSTDPYNLWDIDSGIYVVGRDTSWGWTTGNYMQDWEKPVHVEIFETNGSVVIDQDAGLKLSGALTRTSSQKSMRVIAKSIYGQTKFNYKIFADKDIESFNQYVFRSSGNDWLKTMMADGMMQCLVRGQMNIDLQAYRPGVLYLNGKYWGIHNIREWLGATYTEENYGADPDNIDLITHTKSVRVGDYTNYKAMLDFMEVNDMNNPDVYDYVKTLMDVDNYIDYYVIEIFYSHHDWPAGNIRFWREKIDGARWRWILHDLDLAFLTSQSGHNSLYRNSLDWASNPNYQPEYEGSRKLFIYMLENEEFRNDFASKFNYALNNVFVPDLMISRIDSVQNIIVNEMPRHINLWKDSLGPGRYAHEKKPGIPDMSTWESNIEVFRTFAQNRPDIVRDHLKTFFNLGMDYKLNLSVESEGYGRVEVDGFIVDSDSYKARFYENLPVHIKAFPTNGFRFVRFEKKLSGNVEDETVKLFSKGSEWKYYDLGQDLGTSWKEPGYDDAGWSTGYAMFGYRDEDIVTEISYGSDNENKYVTSYFRTTLNISDPDSYKGLIIHLLRDDGAAVYINGNKVVVDNLPTTFNYQTFALEGVGSSGEDVFFPFTVYNTYLVQGINTIAVEVHQVSASSSDLCFDLEIEGIYSGSGDGEIFQIYQDDLNISLESNTSLKAIFEPSGEEVVLSINEFMSNNNNTHSDNFGEFNDWIEIYNPGEYPVDIGGMYMTDNLGNPSAWQITSSEPDITTIPPGGFLLLWADGNINQGPLHLGFKLSSQGEQIGLFKKVNSQFIVVDSITYFQQPADISFGRYPNGGNAWNYSHNGATPGASNINPNAVTSILIPDVKVFQNYPNPFSYNTTIKFILEEAQNIQLSLMDISGRLIKNKDFGELIPGIYYDYIWDGTDNNGRTINSGIYFYRITGKNLSITKKAILIR